jgi:hypothetical protein
MYKKKIYCFSSEYFSYIDSLNYTPVGLGDKHFPSHWLRDNTGENISHKNSYYDMYTFHYWLWKNQISSIEENTWLGFCTYRRFWNNTANIQNVNNINFKENVLSEIPNEWQKYETILPQKLYFNSIKKIKIFKNYPFFFFKNPSYLFSEKKHTIKTHFEIFHDPEILSISLQFLEKNEKKDFENYLNSRYFHPWNLFFCRSKKLLVKYYESVFPWLFKCEGKLEFSKLGAKGYKTQRIYAYLAERYLSYWFEKYSNYTTWPIIFLDKNTQFKLKN